MRAWYVVYTQPAGGDRRAVEHLKLQGFEVMRFTYTHWKVVNGYVYSAARALFPRYLFVALDLSQPGCQWRRILGTFGVSDMIMAGEQPAPVPDAVIADLLDRADKHGYLKDVGDKMKPEYRLKKGDPVRVTVGQFAGWDAVYQEVTPKGRVRILLSIFGRPMETEVGETQIASAA